jgi:hypothetical protein
MPCEELFAQVKNYIRQNDIAWRDLPSPELMVFESFLEATDVEIRSYIRHDYIRIHVNIVHAKVEYFLLKFTYDISFKSLFLCSSNCSFVRAPISSKLFMSFSCCMIAVRIYICKMLEK